MVEDEPIFSGVKIYVCLVEGMVSMNRNEAIKIIVAKRFETLAREDRELLVYESWGIDETDEEFYLLPKDLQEELLKFGGPQEDVLSSKYDMLIKMTCEAIYSDYVNIELEDALFKIIGIPIMVNGENPPRYPCPCCGMKTLSVRAEYDICSNCGWEDSGCEGDGDYSSPNHMTLGEGRRNYKLYGRCDAPKFIRDGA